MKKVDYKIRNISIDERLKGIDPRVSSIYRMIIKTSTSPDLRKIYHSHKNIFMNFPIIQSVFLSKIKYFKINWNAECNICVKMLNDLEDDFLGDMEFGLIIKIEKNHNAIYSTQTRKKVETLLNPNRVSVNILSENNTIADIYTEIEYECVRITLLQHKGKTDNARRHMGICERSFRNKIKKFKKLKYIVEVPLGDKAFKVVDDKGSFYRLGYFFRKSTVLDIEIHNQSSTLIDDVKYYLIGKALEENYGVRSIAAKKLNISVRTISNMLNGVTAIKLMHCRLREASDKEIANLRNNIKFKEFNSFFKFCKIDEFLDITNIDYKLIGDYVDFNYSPYSQSLKGLNLHEKIKNIEIKKEIDNREIELSDLEKIEDEFDLKRIAQNRKALQNREDRKEKTINQRYLEKLRRNLNGDLNPTSSCHKIKMAQCHDKEIEWENGLCFKCWRVKNV